MGLVLASRRESEGNPQKTVTFGVADRSYRMNAGHKKPATTQENTVTTITTRRSTATKLFSAAAWMLVLPAVALGFAGPAKAGPHEAFESCFHDALAATHDAYTSEEKCCRRFGGYLIGITPGGPPGCKLPATFPSPGPTAVPRPGSNTRTGIQ